VRARTLLVLTMIALALSAIACADRYERALLAEFFAASRLLDRTALQDVSTVIFDPRTDGTVLRFEVERISPEDHNEKRATVSARVHLPGGEIAQRTLIVTMRRADPAVDKSTTSKWIITSVVNEK
jgi:hypothetical protein